jgi:two-component system nitrate/nitrite response regulator NarL
MPASVLIVDDDPLFRSLAARMLAAAGLTVAGEAADVAQGLAAAHGLRPDAALVDVRLPDGDGIALAAQLALLPWSPRVVVVSSDPGVAVAVPPGPSGARLPFVAKEELLNTPLHELLGGE